MLFNLCCIYGDNLFFPICRNTRCSDPFLPEDLRTSSTIPFSSITENTFLSLVNFWTSLDFVLSGWCLVMHILPMSATRQLRRINRRLNNSYFGASIGMLHSQCCLLLPDQCNLFYTVIFFHWVAGFWLPLWQFVRELVMRSFHGRPFEFCKWCGTVLLLPWYRSCNSYPVTFLFSFEGFPCTVKQNWHSLYICGIPKQRYAASDSNEGEKKETPKCLILCWHDIPYFNHYVAITGNNLCVRFIL